jgi:hypothetical protein
MYGYGRVYMLMMGLRHFSLRKIVENSILRIKILKIYAFFGKTIFLQEKICLQPCIHQT